MAATDNRNDQTFNGNELRNWRFEILGAHFVSPATGQPWYRSDLAAAYYWNGTDNVPMDARLRTGIPITNLASLGSGIATWMATPSSANLAAAVTDETGSGALVFATSPSLTTPSLGVATATSINKVAITAPATSATLTLANGSTFATSGAYSVTFTATATTTLTLPTTGTLATLAGAESLTNKKLGSLTSNGFVKTSSSDGTLSVDTNTYLTTSSAASTYQPLDSDLTTIAGLTATTDNFMQAKSGAWASRTIAQVKTDLGLTGTNSGDQTITLSGIVAGSGTGAITTTTGTGFNTAVQASRLDQMAAPTSAVSMNGQRITSVSTPSSSTDAANKQYVDDAVTGGTAGIDAKDAVDTLSSANLTLSGVQNINGVTGSAGVTTILVKDQSTGSQNGIYVMQSGSWTRRADASAGKLTKGSYTLVTGGTYAGTSWMLTTADPITVGTTSQTWVQFNAANDYTAGDGISITGNVVSASAVSPANINDAYISVGSGGTGKLTLVNTASSGKYTITGDGSATSFDVLHNHDSSDVIAHVRNASDQLVICGQDTSDPDKVVLTIKPPIPNAVTWKVLIVAAV